MDTKHKGIEKKVSETVFSLLKNFVHELSHTQKVSTDFILCLSQYHIKLHLGKIPEFDVFGLFMIYSGVFDPRLMKNSDFIEI